MNSLPSTPSEAFKRANPHLYPPLHVQQKAVETFDSMETYTKEEELQIAAEKWLRLHGFMILYRARMDRPSTCAPGVADLLCLRNGRFYALEAKIGTRQPTAAQKDYLASVEQNGGISVVFRNLETLKGLLNAS